MTAVFPIVRLGCTTIDRGQAFTYWKRAIRTKAIIDECCRYPVLDNDCSCWADFPDTAYNNPTTDCAAWYDPNHLESGRFLGIWITNVEGLDDPVISRSTSPSLSGGLSIGGAVVGGRIITIKGILLAQDGQAMSWGQQWFRRFLAEACRWQIGNGDCEGGYLDLRGWCPDPAADDQLGIYELVNVAVAEQPKYSLIAETGKPCSDHIQHFECSVVCGNPRAYWAKEVAMASTTLLGGAILANTTNSCAPAYDPFLSTDPSLIRVAPPTGDGVLPDFDIQGRPSCGAGSALYNSGYETIVIDESGHPSAGPGSRDYLRTPSESPAFDWFGRPSCGLGSADYSKYPATGAVSLVQIASTVGAVAAPALPWSATQTVRIEGLTRSQVQSIYFQFRTASGTAMVRDVVAKLFARNDYSAPSTYLLSTIGPQSPIAGVTITTSATLYGAFGGIVIPNGYLADIELSWQQQVPNTIQLITEYNIGSFGILVGPNAGVDRACRASVQGPNLGFPNDRPLGVGCISYSVLQPQGMALGIPDGSLTAYIGDAASLVHSAQSPEGEQIPGLITPTGQAAYTLGGFDLATLGYSTAIHWMRIRARFSIPQGPNNTPHPWSLYVINNYGEVIGGRVQTLEQREDGETTYLINTPFYWFGSIWALPTVIVNLAAPPGGTPGSLDYLVLETEYYGGPSGPDCGPNAGFDAPCYEPSNWGEPVAIRVRDATYAAPVTHPAHFVTTINSGSGKLFNFRLRAWPNYVGRNGPASSQTDWQYWYCQDSCHVMEIAELDAGSTLVVDGRRRKITLTKNGQTIDGSFLVKGLGQTAFLWPELEGKGTFSAWADYSNPTVYPAFDATIQIDAYPFEGL